jgi:hypothetical protein
MIFVQRKQNKNIKTMIFEHKKGCEYLRLLIVKKNLSQQ